MLGPVFKARCYTQRGIAKASCLSIRPSVRPSVRLYVRPSVTLRYHDHIGEFLENNFTAD